MFQKIHGRTYYVVELKEFPIPFVTDGGDPALAQYAEALNSAMKNGIITEPGKYAIAINTVLGRWDVFKVIEPAMAEAVGPQ